MTVTLNFDLCISGLRLAWVHGSFLATFTMYVEIQCPYAPSVSLLMYEDRSFSRNSLNAKLAKPFAGLAYGAVLR